MCCSWPSSQSFLLQNVAYWMKDTRLLSGQILSSVTLRLHIFIWAANCLRYCGITLIGPPTFRWSSLGVSLALYWCLLTLYWHLCMLYVIILIRQFQQHLNRTSSSKLCGTASDQCRVIQNWKNYCLYHLKHTDNKAFLSPNLKRVCVCVCSFNKLSWVHVHTSS